jgi:hypothetical protein
MKMHDDLKQRLEREAGGLRVPEAPVDRLVSRGRSRRARRRAAGAAGAAVLVVGVVVPLWLLLGLGGSNAGPSRSVHPAAGEQTSSAQTSSAQEPPVAAEHLVGMSSCLESVPPPWKVVILDAPGEDPVKACAQAWSKGSFSSSDGTVPPLVACVKGMSVIVVPGEGATFCADNGFTELPSNFDEVRARWSQVVDESRVTDPHACYDVATLTSRIRDILDRNGFSDWGIEDHWHANSPNGSCAAQGWDFRNLQVTIVNDTVS